MKSRSCIHRRQSTVALNVIREMFEQNMEENTEVIKLLKKPEVAEMFQVTERTIEIWVRDGLLPAFRIGRSVRFDREEIMKHMRARQQI
jgi:excisionase family DNA binding protein